MVSEKNKEKKKDKNKKKNKDKIKNNHNSRFIEELSNGNIISCSTDDKIYIYNKDFSEKIIINLNTEINEDNFATTCNNKLKANLKFLKIIQSILEIKCEKDIVTIMACSKIGLMKLKIYINNINNNNKKFEILKAICLSCVKFFEINNRNGNVNNNKPEYIIIGEKGLFHFDKSPFELNSNENIKEYNKNKTNFRAGIKINETTIALTSNKIKPNGKDKMVIYDTKTKKIIKEIDGSFVLGVNSLELIEIEEKNKKILLCGCKKYISGQENGIMLIDITIKENEELKIKYTFYNTEEFEINCFCQINKEDKNSLIKYFLVGGFENEKREGMIKLMKLDYKENNYYLKELQEIEKNDDKEKYKGTINCIIQQKESNDIIVSCFDGKIYTYFKPNIDFYLNDEESEQSEEID